MKNQIFVNSDSVKSKVLSRVGKKNEKGDQLNQGENLYKIKKKFYTCTICLKTVK